MAETLGDVFKRVLEKTDSIESLEDIPRVDRFIWKTPMGDVQTWQVVQKVPGNDGLLVIAIFRGEDQTLRVYCIPTAAAQGGKVQPPTRYTLTSNSQIVETMSSEVWESEMAVELDELAGGKELAECSSCGELNDLADAFCSSCGFKFPEETVPAPTVPAPQPPPNGGSVVPTP